MSIRFRLQLPADRTVAAAVQFTLAIKYIYCRLVRLRIHATGDVLSSCDEFRKTNCTTPLNVYGRSNRTTAVSCLCPLNMVDKRLVHVHKNMCRLNCGTYVKCNISQKRSVSEEFCLPAGQRIVYFSYALLTDSCTILFILVFNSSALRIINTLYIFQAFYLSHDVVSHQMSLLSFFH